MPMNADHEKLKKILEESTPSGFLAETVQHEHEEEGRHDSPRWQTIEGCEVTPLRQLPAGHDVPWQPTLGPER